MHLKTKLGTALAFSLLLNAAPASAQQPWTPLQSGDWNSITWDNGEQYGRPGDADAISISGNRIITNGSATHTGDLTILGKLSLTSYTGQLRTGVVEVGGTNSEWTTSGIQKFDKITGKDQSLTVTNGGKMQTWQTQIGITGGDYAEAVVTRLGTQLIQQERLTVGYTGNGRLSITNQASVTANNSIIGDAVGSNGEVTVQGVKTSDPMMVQTQFHSGARLTVGKQGTGSLAVTDLATVTAKNIVIGGQADDGLGVKGNGIVTVSGGSSIPNQPKSTFSATEGDIKIGDGGIGHLIVNDNGVVSASGKILLGSNGGSGKITIGDTEQGWFPPDVKRTGLVQASEIHGDGGTADVDFYLNPLDGMVNFATRITGNTTVNIDGIGGGAVRLNAVNTYTGGTNIYGAALYVSNADQVGTGTIYVEGGSLGLGAGVTLSNKIELADGNYSKETEVGEDLSMSVQSAEIGGTSTSAGILAGTQSAASPVDVSFGLASDAGNDDLRISDVFSISGTGESIFVLELAVENIQSGAFLSWLDTDSGIWVNAIDGNTGNTDYSLEQFLGTYEEFTLLNSGDLADHLGAWGIYDSGVWAVINHNSDFSIVAPIPEPSTYALILGGAFALHMIRRRRK